MVLFEIVFVFSFFFDCCTREECKFFTHEKQCRWLLSSLVGSNPPFATNTSSQSRTHHTRQDESLEFQHVDPCESLFCCTRISVCLFLLHVFDTCCTRNSWFVAFRVPRCLYTHDKRVNESTCKFLWWSIDYIVRVYDQGLFPLDIEQAFENVYRIFYIQNDPSSE